MLILLLAWPRVSCPSSAPKLSQGPVPCLLSLSGIAGMAYDVTPGWPISTLLSPHKVWCRRIISTSPIQFMRPTAAFRLTPENTGRNSSRLRLIQASEAGAAKNARFLPFPTTLHQPNHPNLRRHRQRSTVKMSWFGVTPLKKFPAPVCMSIGFFFDTAAALGRE